MRIVLKIQYDGTNYCGWQIQPNGNTVQAEIERAITTVTGEKCGVTASGRTDSGVHALGQIAHFDTNSSIPPEKFYSALNAVLPDDIKVLSSSLAPSDFHARFSAKRKTYEYKMYLSEFPLPLKDRYAARIIPPFDLEKAEAAAKTLVGKHDFKCFLAANSSVKDTVREIYRSEMTEKDGYIIYTVTGNGFLYNMVRIIAGTLLKVGQGKATCEDVANMLAAKDRALAGATMPAKGLTLVEVKYE